MGCPTTLPGQKAASPDLSQPNLLSDLLWTSGLFCPSQFWSDEEAPLHLAAYCGHNDVVGMLVERGADVDAYNVYRDTLDCVTPLHFAVYKGPFIKDVRTKGAGG